MWIVSGNMADLVIAITGSGFLCFLLIYSVDFYGFIGIGVPGFILSLMFVFLYKELLSSLFFVSLDNLSVNLKGKLYYTNYIGGSVYLRDLILDIIL